MLIDHPLNIPSPAQYHRTYVIPKLSWDLLSQTSTTDIYTCAKDWESIALKGDFDNPNALFALESTPSLHPRFPLGTLFIVKVTTKVEDGAIILIKFRDTQQISLRELIADPPIWHLAPLVSESNIIQYDESTQEIVGVIMMTLLKNVKLR